MEVIHRRHITSKFAPEDVISNMPDIVITNILDRLPLQDAVRTSVLSSNWRYKWTTLSQLVFDEYFFGYLFKRIIKDNHIRIISRILLHLRGSIIKFVLSVNASVLDAEDISHWILFLSRKGIKDLTLKNWSETPLELPPHLFSCLELTHLKLNDCSFHPPPGFHGFPNLLSLELSLHDQSSELGEVFTGCPLLEILNLKYLDSTGDVKLVEIAKFENLKILSVSLTDFDPEITCSGTIFELVGYFPKLQELHLDFLTCELTEGGAKKGFPTTFPCLKTLKLSDLDLGIGSMVSCFIEMVTSFPNLQALEIETCYSWAPSTICSPGYNTMGLLQLRSVVFTYWNASENEVCLIKYLLACSPFLQKIVIHPHFSSPHTIVSDKKFMFATKLLKLHRASPVVDIDLR